MFSRRGEPVKPTKKIATDLKKLYKNYLRKFEEKFQFHEFHDSPIDEAYFESKATVLLIGQYSVGKSTFIKHLLDNGYVVAVPTISHFVCIIGYNDNSLLFLGSFGEQISTGGLHELETDIFSPQEIADSIMDCLYVKVA